MPRTKAVPQEPFFLRFDPECSTGVIHEVFQNPIARSLWMLIRLAYGLEGVGLSEWCLERAEEFERRMPRSAEELYRRVAGSPMPDGFAEFLGREFWKRALRAIDGSDPVRFQIDEGKDKAPKKHCRHCQGDGNVPVWDGSEQGALAACGYVSLLYESPAQAA